MVSNLFHDSGLDVYNLLGDKRMAIYQNIETACRAIKAMVDYFEYQAGSTDPEFMNFFP